MNYNNEYFLLPWCSPLIFSTLTLINEDYISPSAKTIHFTLPQITVRSFSKTPPGIRLTREKS